MGDRFWCEFHIKISLPEPIFSINHVMEFVTTQKVYLARTRLVQKKMLEEFLFILPFTFNFCCQWTHNSHSGSLTDSYSVLFSPAATCSWPQAPLAHLQTHIRTLSHAATGSWSRAPLAHSQAMSNLSCCHKQPTGSHSGLLSSSAVTDSNI